LDLDIFFIIKAPLFQKWKHILSGFYLIVEKAKSTNVHDSDSEGKPKIMSRAQCRQCYLHNARLCICGL